MSHDLLEELDIEASAKNEALRKPAKKYHIRIDETRYTITDPRPTGRELLALACKQPCSHDLTQVLVGCDDEYVSPDEKVDLLAKGVERFTVVAKDKVTIFIGGAPFEVKRGDLTGAAIKQLAGIDPSYVVVEDRNGQLVPVADDAHLDIHGCEEFDSHPPVGGSS